MLSSLDFFLQVVQAVKEYACTAVDVLARRTRIAYLNTQAAEEALPTIINIMKKELKWSNARAEKEKKEALEFLYHEMGVKVILQALYSNDA